MQGVSIAKSGRGPFAILAVSLIGVITSLSAVAEDTEIVDEIIVEATRFKKPASQVPASIGVVGKDDVQLGRQQLGLDESLVGIPGLFLQDRYNFAQDLRIAIRGFGARSNFGIRGVKIIVDGIPETLPDGQGQVDAIDLGSVQQIEVIKGPASSLYGNASGGVVNIASETGPEQPFIESRFSFGDDGFAKYQLKAGGDTGRLNYMMDVSDMSYDGYRGHSETENTQLNSRFALQIDDSQALTVILNATDQPMADDPGGINRAQADADPRSARQQNLDFNAGEALDQQKLGLVYTKSFNDKHELLLRTYYVWRDFANRLPFTAGGAVEIDRIFAGGGGSYTYSGSVRGKPSRLIVGVDIDRQDDDRKRFDNDLGTKGVLTFDQNEKVTSYGIFAQNELSIRDDLTMTLGLRYDRLTFDVGDHFLSNGDDSGKRTLNEISPMIGFVYSALPTLNFYANVSTAFETPTTTEFANPSGAGGFNPDLDPQYATNYELGLKGALGGRNRFEISLFRIDVDDELIPFELASQPGRDFFNNAGESSRNGVELAFVSQPWDGLRFALAYTYSDFKFEKFADDNGNDFSGNSLPGVPEHLLHGELKYTHSTGFYGLWDFLSVGDLFVDNANSEESASYLLSNLRTGFAVRAGAWEIAPFVGINNLFDEEYFGNVRINAFGGRFFEPAPGRHGYGGVSLRYNF